MANMYGYAWVNAFGEAPSDTWIWGLADFTEIELKRGLTACRDRPGPYPPSIGEFREMGKPKNLPYHKAFSKALPPPRADKETAKARIKDIKDLLNTTPDFEMSKLPPVEPVSSTAEESKKIINDFLDSKCEQ